MTPADGGPGVTGLRQVALPFRDVETSIRFYRDVLGLPFLFSAGPDLAFLAIGDVRLMLSRDTEGEPSVGDSVLYLAVPSVDRAHAAVLAAGGTDERGPRLTATMPDHELWIAFVRDPDGRLVGLMEERALQA